MYAFGLTWLLVSIMLLCPNFCWFLLQFLSGVTMQTKFFLGVGLLCVFMFCQISFVQWLCFQKSPQVHLDKRAYHHQFTHDLWLQDYMPIIWLKCLFIYRFHAGLWYPPLTLPIPISYGGATWWNFCEAKPDTGGTCILVGTSRGPNHKCTFNEGWGMLRMAWLFNHF